MFAQLGTYTFNGLVAPRSLDTSDAAKYGRIPLINGREVLQKTGDELQELTLTIQYAVEFCNPAEEIEQLKTSMQSAEVLPFIMGDGVVLGKYVIQSIDTKNERYTPDGVLEAARVTLSLLEYANGEEHKTTGQALKSARPVPQTPIKPVTSPAAAITNDISQAQSNVNRIKQIQQAAKGNISTFKRNFFEVRKLSGNTIQLYTSAKNKVEATQKIAQRAAHLPGSLEEGIHYADNLAKLDDAADFTVIDSNINALCDSADKIGVHASPVAAFGATKEGGN